MDGLSESTQLRRQIQADIIGLQWILDHTKNSDDAKQILDSLLKHKRAMARIEADKKAENAQ